MSGRSFLRLAASVTAIASASMFAQVAFAQAAAPPTSPMTRGEQANPGDSLAADAEGVTEQRTEQAVATPNITIDDEDTGLGEDSQDVSEIVVTGTAIRGVAPVGSATVDISRDTIVQSGVRDASSLIAALPQGSGLGTTLTSTGGRSAGVNLRGLGNSATLLLFDGHRTVSQGQQNLLADPNTIPFGAVQRVEVVTDGASAVYGSDAVAGVVNYILRRPFDGGEITARYTNTLYNQYAADAIVGKTWSSGGLIAAISYETNDNVLRSEIPQLAADQRPYGGNDNRFNAGDITPAVNGAILANGVFYGLPTAQNGTRPTAAQLAPVTEADLFDTGTLGNYYNEREKVSALVRVEQDLGSAGEIRATLLFDRRTNFAFGAGDGDFTAGQEIRLTVRPTSPFFIPGLGTGNQTIYYNYRLNNPDRPLNRRDYQNTINLLLDYQVPLFGDFRLTVGGAVGHFEGCAVCQPQGNTVIASTILDRVPAGQTQPFNPYLGGPQAGAENLFGVFLQKGKNQIFDLLPKIDGSIFTLPAGEVRIAVGGEYTHYKYKQHSLQVVNAQSELRSTRLGESDRDVYSAFGEVFVPIFGPDNATTLFQRLDLSAAIRYDYYSDFGSTTNPKVGLTWEPFEDLLLRGSWGTSFRAPSLSETNFAVAGQANRQFFTNNVPSNNPALGLPLSGPAANNRTLLIASSLRFNQLKPETAEIFSLGADYTPSFIDGLRLGVTYYNVNYTDRIAGLPGANTALLSAENYQLYRPFIIVAPQPATCVNGISPGQPGQPEYATYNPLYLKYLEPGRQAIFGAAPGGANDCQLQGIIDTSTRNLGSVIQAGVDFTLNYRRDIGFAELSVDGSFTKILDLRRNILPGTPLVEQLDVIGEQISQRGRGSVGLTSGPFSGNISANYVGGYLNASAQPVVNGVQAPAQNVPAWTTFDFNLSFAPEVEDGFLSGTRFTVSARNFTDKDAPITRNGTVALDDAVHNPFGRILTFEVSKEF